MITAILIAIAVFFAIAMVAVTWAKGARRRNGMSGIENRGTPQDPREDRAIGPD